MWPSIWVFDQDWPCCDRSFLVLWQIIPHVIGQDSFDPIQQNSFGLVALGFNTKLFPFVSRPHLRVTCETRIRRPAHRLRPVSEDQPSVFGGSCSSAGRYIYRARTPPSKSIWTPPSHLCRLPTLADPSFAAAVARNEIAMRVQRCSVLSLSRWHKYIQYMDPS